MLLDDKLTPKSNSNAPAPTAENSTEKASAPTVTNTVTNDAKIIVLAVGGFMIFIFLLDKLEQLLHKGRGVIA